MRDDYLDRSWADHHGDLSDTIHNLFRSFMISMERLNALEYDAPWKAHASNRGPSARR